MSKKFILILIVTPWIYCTAAERKITIPTNCNSFKTCYDKSQTTDIYRNKIRYLDGALHFWRSTDGEGLMAKALVERASYIVKEAGGETGYKGSDMNLKVTHKKEYKETSYSAAITDLTEAIKYKSSLNKDEMDAAKDLLKQTTKLLEEL
ncbi:MAG: hypothetical protein CK427_08230 [Leptospira sp.]|nr:MAG: hypothetical protein CK427_08230 [Leptospira sp.]